MFQSMQVGFSKFVKAKLVMIDTFTNTDKTGIYNCRFSCLTVNVT